MKCDEDNEGRKAIEEYRIRQKISQREAQKSAENVQKNERCFVASVVYGGRDVEQVKILREYRDNVLMQDELGKKFVDWYYAGGGERMAEFVRGRGRFLIPIIRKGLDFIVRDYLCCRDGDINVWNIDYFWFLGFSPIIFLNE